MAAAAVAPEAVGELKAGRRGAGWMKGGVGDTAPPPPPLPAMVEAVLPPA